jgi:hypothetical protein
MAQEDLLASRDRCAHENVRDIADDCAELLWGAVEVGSECCPLSLLQGIFGKRQRKRVWRIRGDCCRTPVNRVRRLVDFQ